MIDLSVENTAQLSGVVFRYTEAGRKVAQLRRGAVGGTHQGTTGGGRSDLAAIREWAKANGHEVPERGRIRGMIIDTNDAVHGRLGAALEAD